MLRNACSMKEAPKLRAHLWPQGPYSIPATAAQTLKAEQHYYAHHGLQTYFEYPNPMHPDDPMKRLGYRLAFYPVLT